MFPYVNTLEQGDLGELSAMEWLASVGASIYIPVGHSPDVDVLADLDGRLLRVQVKTSRSFRNSRWAIRVCTRGGNQSWNGVTKQMDPSRCDYLFVLVGDGRRWFIPSDRVEGGHAILLGGPKYAEFEVERGRPLERQEASTIAA
jgi:PD-(D/E)XK nuclease superfamily protein